MVTVIVYWSVLHNEIIDRFEGYRKLHMYLVHIFPTIAYVLNARMTEFELDAGHWKLFVPLGILYAIVNYFETQRLGRPLYWFMTWQDWTTPVIAIGLQIAFSLLWIVLAKICVRKKANSENKKAQ